MSHNQRFPARWGAMIGAPRHTREATGKLICGCGGHLRWRIGLASWQDDVNRPGAHGVNSLSGLRGYEKGFSGGMVRTLSVKSVQSVVTPVGLMAVEITLQELNYRSGARAYREILLNGPPRRARGKLSKRITRIRGKAINNDSRRSGVESGSWRRRKKKPTAKKRKDAKNCSGKYFVFVALGPCGGKHFLLTRRKQRWGEGVTEQRLLNGTCPGRSGWNLEPGTWKLEEPGKDYQPQKKQKNAKKWLGS